ncbi:hypothetical protein AB4059_01875 [Lysobacter sp. 2RAF19]
MNRHTLAIALLCVALAGAIAWGIAGRMHDAPAIASPTATTDTIEQRQAALDARMDRMERMITGLADAAGVAIEQPSAAKPHSHGAEGAESSAAVEARREQAQRQAEAAFVAEPVAQAWANQQSRTIARAFSSENLARLHSPAPRFQQAECRSRSCRIEAVYANAAQAEEAQLYLLSDLAGSMDRSRPFQRTLPDGSVELTMYAFAATARGASR